MPEALKPKCSRCGTELPAKAPRGHCLACLLQLGLAANESAAPTALSPLREPVQTIKFAAAADWTDVDVGMTIGRYNLLEKVGEGGCGVVYVAEQIEPVRRRVALKLIKLGMDSKAVVARFEAERQALAMMDHPGIAKVLDAAASETGRPYFVMELVRGIRITDYCDLNQLSTKERLDLFIKVCHAIQHAHQKGIIHRDIKPSNILVTLHDGVPVPKVIDFGIAKATEGRLTDATVYTQLHQFIGTPAYMSPEQAEMTGLDIDTRSDIYSLGVLLYELLAGATPFDAKELMASGLDAMRKTIREKEPVRPSTRFATLKGEELTATAKRRSTDTSKLLHQLEGDLDWIVMRCLEKDRTRRYETANGLARDLLRHLGNEPVLARPPSRLYRFQKLIKRNKLACTAAAAVMMALLAGLSLASIGWGQARLARDRAIEARTGEAAQRVQAQANEQKARQAQSQEAQERAQAQALELTARQRAYASDMNLAQQALSADNLGRGQALLDRHRPSQSTPDRGGQEAISEPFSDLRGWEWRYLWKQCQSEALYEMCRCPNPISSVTLSSDGRWLAVGEYDQGGLSIWDLRTRQKIATLSAGEAEVMTAFSPRGGLLAFSLATAMSSPTTQYSVRLWDAETRQMLDVELKFRRACRGLAFGADGRKLFALSMDNRLTLWEVSGGAKAVSFSVPTVDGQAPLLAFAVTPDGSLLAYPAPGGEICVVDSATGSVRWTAKAANGVVSALAFSPNGQMLASGAGFAESAIRLWDVPTGKQIGRPLEGHRAWVGALVFWPDGTRLASASADQTIRLWDLTDRNRAQPVGRPLLGHKLEIWSLALFPDNRTLVSGCKDGSVYAWDIANLRVERNLVTLPAKLTTWSFGTNADSVVTVDQRGQVARWLGAGWQDKQPLVEVGAGALGICLSREGRLVAVGFPNGSVGVWDVQERKLLKRFTVRAKHPCPWNFVGAGSRLVIFDLDQRGFSLFDLKTWDEVRSWRPALKGFSFSGVDDPQSGRLAPLIDFFEGAVSSDGHRMILLDYFAGSWISDIVSGRETKVELDLREAEAASFSSDDKRFAAASGLGFARVWDTATWRPLATFSGFLMGVHSAVFSPDGKRLATGSDTREAVRLWDLESQQDVLTLEGEGALFRITAFSPDRQALGSMNDEGLLHLWRAPSWGEIALTEKPTAPETKR